MTTRNQVKLTRSTRRQFLRMFAAAGAAVAANAYAAGNDLLRVGLIGCGARGTGAVENCVKAAPNVKLVALGDVFKDRIESCRDRLKKLGDKMAVPDAHCFVGFDAYQKVIGSEVDLVILATPGAFRPVHIQAAVAAGKHIFAETPVAVDATGVRRVLAAYAEAKKKNLAIVAGTQRRYQKGYQETIQRLHRGEIGDIVSAQCWWNQGLYFWYRDRLPAWSDMEWQLRDWPYFVWLSGDIIVDQLLHNLDVVNWALRAHPLRVSGEGGRLERKDPEYGNVYDHFRLAYQYPGNVLVKAQCQQLKNGENRIGETFQGAKGSCEANRFSIVGASGKRPEIPSTQGNDPYLPEHVALIESIRAGTPINNLQDAAESTLTAIMGRMAAYRGEIVTWEKALQDKEDLMPARLEFGPLAVAPVASPRRLAKDNVELPNLYVLAIGISAYPGNLKLDYAAKDAQAIEHVFKENSRTMFRNVETKLLIDKQGNRGKILQGLTWLRRQMTQRDVAVVFFAGHGQKDSDGSFYLLPADVDTKDLLATGVADNDLNKSLAATPGRILVLLDACHAGAWGGDRRRAASPLTEDLVRDLVTDDRGVVVMASSMSREFSMESNEKRQGYFTLALVEGLSGKAANKEGVVYLAALDAYVTERVKELTKGQQHPVTEKRTSIRSFPLTKP